MNALSLIIIFLLAFLLNYKAAADLIDTEKANIARCEFAVMAARVPPSIPIKVICEKPFKMIDDDEMVSVDCREYCKVKGIK